MPHWEVMIGDGAKTYPKALLSQKRSCFLIQHIHSHPWEYVLLHSFRYYDNKTLHTIVEIPYDAFVSSELQGGHTMTKVHSHEEKRKRGRPKGSKKKPTKIEKPKRKRGRPKGSKNKTTKIEKPKRKRGRPKGSKNKTTKIKKPRRKRGPKTVRSAGRPFVFSPSHQDQFLDIHWIGGIQDSHYSASKEEVQRLLWLTFCIFKGGYITSNRIESKNNEIKQFLGRGLKKPEHYETRLSQFFLLHGWKTDNKEYDTSTNHFGFQNLDKFIKSDISRIAISSE